MGYPERLLPAVCAVFLLCAFAAFSPLRGEDGPPAPSAAIRSATPVEDQSTGPAQKKRVALLIGNSDYQNYPDLRNPNNDARALGTVLRRLDFNVAVGVDLDAVAFRKAIQNFLDNIDKNTVALFFYAGHGVQVNGLNYMLPTDAKLTSESDLEFEAIRFNYLLEPLERDSGIGIVFLDACRDNPLANTLSGSKTRSLMSSRGLAPVQTGEGLFIGYATQPDNVASDGNGPNSPFTTAMLHHLETPGYDIEMLMRRVRDDVIAATDHAQVPWSNSSLSSEGFSFKPSDVTGSPVANIPPDPERQLELELWRSIGDSTDPSLLEGYLRRYPKGIFSDIAKSRLNGLDKKSKSTSVQPTDIKKPTQPENAKKTPVKTQTKTQPTDRSATTKPIPEGIYQSGTSCRDNNIARCRLRCQQGKKKACEKLKRMGL
jgi:hypothetical protein